VLSNFTALSAGQAAKTARIGKIYETQRIPIAIGSKAHQVAILAFYGIKFLLVFEMTKSVFYDRTVAVV
jgi:hypothetical protein